MSKFDELGFTLRTKDISVPGFPRPIRVRELTISEWAEILSVSEEKQKRRLVSLAVMTPAGERAFETDDPDVEKLSTLAINDIAEKVAKMNSAEEDAAKN